MLPVRTLLLAPLAAFAIARRDYGLSYDSRINPIGDTVRVQFDMSVAERR